MNGAVHAAGPEVVKSALAAMRVNSAQIRGAVTHFPDQPGALNPFLDEGTFKRLAPQTRSHLETPECFATVLGGVGVAAVAYLADGGGEPSLSVHLSDPPALSSGRAPDAGRRPDATGRGAEWVTQKVLEANRVSQLEFTDTVTDEFLIELPDETSSWWEPSAPLLRAVKLVADAVAARKHPLTFLHCPASPPAARGHWRVNSGPCVRFGVATPRQAAGARIRLADGLVQQCAGAGFRLWARGITEHDAGHDYWRRLFPIVVRAVPGGPADPVAAPTPVTLGPRLAVSCVGPARQGTTATLVRQLAAADVGLYGLSTSKLDDLSVFHLVINRPPERIPRGPGWREAVSGLPGSKALCLLLGLDAGGSAEAGLDEFRVVASTFPRYQTLVDPLGRQALWLAWSVPAGHNVLEAVVSSASAAVRDTLATRQKEGQEAKPSIEYVISRTAPIDRLRGRAKLSLNLEALEDIGERDTGTTHWLGRLCSDIEDRWRDRVTFKLATSRHNLDVVWRESWLGRSPLL